MANVSLPNDVLCKLAVVELSKRLKPLPEKPATHWIDTTLDPHDLMSSINDVSQRIIWPAIEELIAKLDGAEGRFHPVLPPAGVPYSRQTIDGFHVLLIQMPPDFSDQTTFRLAVAYC